MGRCGMDSVLSAIILGWLLLAAGCGGGGPGEREGSGSGNQEAASAADREDMSDVVLTRLDGTRVRLSELEGKFFFVTFLATWHEDSQKMVPILSGIHRKFKKNVRVMAVAMDEQGAGAVRSFFSRQGVEFEVFLEGERTANSFGGARDLPTTYILHRDGRLYYRIDGLQRTKKYEEVIISMYKKRL